MNCPVADHLLVDGIVVDNPKIVKFIQKMVADYRQQEKVCRECFRQIEGVFHEKRKRAKAIAIARCGATISTIHTSSSGSQASLHLTQESIDSIDRVVQQTPKHSKRKKPDNTTIHPSSARSLSHSLRSNNSSVPKPVTPMRSIQNILSERLMATSSRKDTNSKKTTKGTVAGTTSAASSSSSIPPPPSSSTAGAAKRVHFDKVRLSQEPAAAAAVPQTMSTRSTSSCSKTSDVSSSANSFVTVRRRTIPDFVSKKTNSNSSVRLDSEMPTTSKAAAIARRTTPRKRPATPLTNSNSGIRLDSEMPTTSKAAAIARRTTPRKIPASPLIILDSDDEEPALSLNAYNGTYMPSVQPIPPARRPRTDLTPAQIAMENYAKDITGG